jgi:hypothetical protein
MRLGLVRRPAFIARLVGGFVVASGLMLLAAQPAGASTVWTYGNYLNSLNIGSFKSPIAAGDGATVEATVGANTAVDVHVEFKGQFSWGSWTYSSDVIPITGAGTFTVTGSPVVPYKALIDPAQYFFDYVFVTLPGDSWSPAAWGLTRTVQVIAPTQVTHAELADLMSQLKFEVNTSSIAPELKDSLMDKLNRAGQAIDQSYAQGKPKRLQRAIEALGAFIRELGSDQEGSDRVEARPPDAALWAQQATFIRSEVARALPIPNPKGDSGSSD